MKKAQKKSPRLYLIAIAISGILSLIMYWTSGGSSPSADNTREATANGVLKDLMLGQEPAKANTLDTKGQKGINSLIEGLILAPQRPTVQDSLKVEVKALTAMEGKLSYRYQWQINGKVVEDAKGNVLPAGLAKKNDRITVTVIPSVDGVEYNKFQYAANTIIYNAAPSLVLKEETRKEGDVVKLQLKAEDPDGDQVSYALEQPLLDGMTIDKGTGEITWKPTVKQVGINRFGASATDSSGSKITKTFEFSLNSKQLTKSE